MAGMGLGFVSIHTVDVEVATSRLVVLPIAGMPVIRHWYAIHRKTKDLSPPATAFKTFLIDHGGARLRTPSAPMRAQ